MCVCVSTQVEGQWARGSPSLLVETELGYDRYRTMRHRVALVIIILLAGVMVSHGSGDKSGTSTTSGSTETLHIGKSFSHCAKLVKNNYSIWMASLLTMVMSYTTYRGMTEVLHILETFKEHGGKAISEIDGKIEAWFTSRFSSAGTHGRKEEGSMYFQANRTLFQILYNTIDESLAALQSSGANTYFMDGLAFLKAAFDKHGPGSGAKQLAQTVNIMDEKQTAEQSAEEFAEKLENINGQLEQPIAENLLCQFYIRGLQDAELKSYLIQQQLLQKVSTISGLKQLANEHDIHQGLAHGTVDGMFAGLGRGRGGRGGQGPGRGSRGRGGSPPYRQKKKKKKL
jgi:hypothetical protein